MAKYNFDGSKRLFVANCQMTREAVQRAAAEIAPRQSVHLQEAVRCLDVLEVWVEQITRAARELEAAND